MVHCVESGLGFSPIIETPSTGFFRMISKYTPGSLLNLGIRYESVGNPRDSAYQALNSIASVPGVVEFNVPKTDKNNWAPDLAFPGTCFGTGKTSLRGGARVGYDVVFGNLAILQLPPQLQRESNPDLACLLSSPPAYCSDGGAVGPPAAGGFLSSGALPHDSASTHDGGRCAFSDRCFSRRHGKSQDVYLEFGSATRVHQGLACRNPVCRNAWSESADYEIRRSGGIPIPLDRRLPTYMNASEIPTNASALPSLADTLNYPGSGTLALESFGFDGGFMTAFDPIGNSIYHGGSIDVQRRAAKGLYFRGGYTFSKVIDDSTNGILQLR